ncbi:cytochrome c biogenesis protein ResB [Timonella sp. A28]|uniref:cytochrome c biogenesis protein ResB n=1 Tax=Timonella sp. A28 TaxID=3442640 RepID=UPI003EBF659A
MENDEAKKPDEHPYVPQGKEDIFREATAEKNSAQSIRAPKIGFAGMLRFIWRQLTSMRVALMLLMLLAIAAVPGSMFPQRAQDPAKVAEYLQNNPKLGPWLDKFGFFEVFASPWFAAIYILLFISLIGCILPRTKAHWQALRSAPPKTPRVFTRFPAQGHAHLEHADAQHVIENARTQMRGRVPFLPRYRTVTHEESPSVFTLSAERGYLKETGNLLFHLALLGILVSFGAGQLLEYRGQALVIEGRGFANSQMSYDSFERGAWFNEDSMVPFTMTLDSFESVFRASDSAAQDFTAHVTVTEPDGTHRSEDIKVNEPLKQNGAKVYLMGNGHAPVVTIRDANGEVAFSGAVPFLPQDAQYTSNGVIKVPDVSTGEQLGFVGYLLPTAELTEGQMRSLYPEALNPFLILDLYEGNLGLDSGIPQNVYKLNTDSMEKITGTPQQPDPLVIGLGQTLDLPGGRGTIEFSEIPRYAAFDLRYDPTLAWLLVWSLVALAGLAISLFTPRRRVWVRVTQSGETVDIAVAGLARGDDSGLHNEIDRLIAIFHKKQERTPEEKRAARLASREV